MLLFALFGLLFVLIGLSGFQFAYMFYFDRINRERKNHLRILEKRAARLSVRLKKADAMIAEQEAIIERYHAVHGDADDSWADVIIEN